MAKSKKPVGKKGFVPFTKGGAKGKVPAFKPAKKRGY